MIPATVFIPVVYPQQAIVPQNPSVFPETLDEFGDMLIGRFFEAELTRHAVIPLAPVRRGSDENVDALIGQRSCDFNPVPAQNLIDRQFHSSLVDRRSYLVQIGFHCDLKIRVHL
jgi:hypothetical protein